MLVHPVLSPPSCASPLAAPRELPFRCSGCLFSLQAARLGHEGSKKRGCWSRAQPPPHSSVPWCPITAGSPWTLHRAQMSQRGDAQDSLRLRSTGSQMTQDPRPVAAPAPRWHFTAGSQLHTERSVTPTRARQAATAHTPVCPTSSYSQGAQQRVEGTLTGMKQAPFSDLKMFTLILSTKPRCVCVCAHTRVRVCHVFSCSVVSDSFSTQRTVASQAPLSIGLSRQEYWSGLPFSPPGNLPNPGMEPESPVLQADSLLLSHRGRPQSQDTKG